MRHKKVQFSNVNCLRDASKHWKCFKYDGYDASQLHVVEVNKNPREAISQIFALRRVLALIIRLNNNVEY